MSQLAATNPTTKMVTKTWYPWLIWALAACFFFYKNMVQVSPGIMTQDLMSTFGVGAAGLGSLTAFYFDAYLLMQVPGGILVDRFGLRRLTAVAILLCAISTLLFATAHSLVTASIARAMIGFAAAFAPVSCFKLVAVWFPTNRFALLVGSSLTFGMLGAVVGEAPLAALVQHVGWREALMLISIPGIILAILYWSFVRDKAVVHAPEHVELTFGGFFRELGLVLTNSQTWLLCLFSGFAYAPLSAFGGLWGVPFLSQAQHLSPTEVASTVSMVFIGFAIGAPLSGWFSDFIGRRVIVSILGTLLALVSLSIVIYFPMMHRSVLSILLFLFGFGSGTYFLCFAMIRELNTLALAATVIGFMNTFDSVWEAFTHPLIGLFLDKLWHGQMINGVRVFSLTDYQLSLLILPLYLLAGLVLLFFVKETYCQQQK